MSHTSITKFCQVRVIQFPMDIKFINIVDFIF